MEIVKRFILVDDSNINNVLCTFGIKRVFPEMDVKSFLNPETALEYIEEEYSDKGHNISTILLLDINMPEMSGWEFLEVFKNFSDHLHSQFSIYILTSSVSQIDKTTSEQTPFVSGFLSKPLDADWIRDKFSQKVPLSENPENKELP